MFSPQSSLEGERGKETRLKEKKSFRMRHRAPKACLSCRARKVRCDATSRGPSCNNCLANGIQCVLVPRASRRPGDLGAGRRKTPQPTRQAQSDIVCEAGSNEDCIENQVISALGGNHENSITNSSFNDYLEHYLTTSPGALDMISQIVGPSASGVGSSCSSQMSSSEVPPDVFTTISRRVYGRADSPLVHAGLERDTVPKVVTPESYRTRPFTEGALFGYSQSHSEGASISIRDSGSPSNVFESSPKGISHGQYSTVFDKLHCDYPFVRLNNLKQLSSEELTFLQKRGCFHLPARDILDEFVRSYFLYVHPFLPLLDEGWFWDMYSQSGCDDGEFDGIALLLLQAMLFSACNFVALSTVQGLGFHDIRSARSIFYHRAKLLHDLGTESCPVAITQAALLLTFWCPIPEQERGQKHMNTVWLGIAILNLRDLGAPLLFDEHNEQQDVSPPRYNSRMLRRLWWCCVIRDRVMPLCLRRPVLITEAYPILLHDDFEEEICRSRVYPPEVKESLLELFMRTMKLTLILGDFLPILCRLNEPLGLAASALPRLEDVAKLTECRSSLRSWYEATQRNIPSSNNKTELRHDSITIFTQLMYMYYYTADLTLSQQELLLGSCAADSSDQMTSLLKQREEQVKALQRSSLDMTHCLRKLEQLNLLRYLPSSAVCFVGLPLFIQLLDTKLSSPRDGNAERRKSRLHTLLRAMSEYRIRFDSAYQVSAMIRLAIDHAQLDHPPRDGGRGGWADMLTLKPTTYLRLSFSLLLCMNRPSLFKDEDLPLILRRSIDYEGSMLSGSLSVAANDSWTQRVSGGSRSKTTSPSQDTVRDGLARIGSPAVQPIDLDGFDVFDNIASEESWDNTGGVAEDWLAIFQDSPIL